MGAGCPALSRPCWVTRGWWLPILPSASPAAQRAPTRQSWAARWLLGTKRAAGLSPGGFTVYSPTDGPSRHVQTISTPHVLEGSAPTAFKVGNRQTHCPWLDKQPGFLEVPKQASKIPLLMSSLWHLNETFPPTPRQEISDPSSLPREPAQLGRGRESPRHFIKAREVTWLSIFVPVPQLEKLKHRDAGSRTALTPIPSALEPRPEPPWCWRHQLLPPAQG